MKASVLSLGMAVVTAAVLAAACGAPDDGLAGRGSKVPGAENETKGDSRSETSPNATYEDPRDSEVEVAAPHQLLQRGDRSFIAQLAFVDDADPVGHALDFVNQV